MWLRWLCPSSTINILLSSCWLDLKVSEPRKWQQNKSFLSSVLTILPTTTCNCQSHRNETQELGAEMLGWILGAQPTATTQYPIVHQPRYFEDKDKDNNKEKNEDKDFLSVFLWQLLCAPGLNISTRARRNLPTNQPTNKPTNKPTPCWRYQPPSRAPLCYFSSVPPLPFVLLWRKHCFKHWLNWCRHNYFQRRINKE